MKVLEKERNYLKNIVRQAYLILKKKKKDLWDFLEKEESVVSSQNQFTGSLPVVYGPHKLLNVRPHKLLADMSSLEE